MGQCIVNIDNIRKKIRKVMDCFGWSTYKPVILSLIWLFAILGVIIFLFSTKWGIVLICLLLFVLLLPLPFITFPLIIVSIMNNTGQRQKGINSIMYIDSRQIAITDIPSQHKIYCFRKSSYNIHLCYNGELYSKVANLYEERVCSLEIIVDD
jgi:hypothetical protein